MDIIKAKFAESKEYQAIKTGLNNGLKDQLIAGLTGSAKQVLFATLYQEENRPLIIVTHNLLQAQKVYDDLTELISNDQIFLYPANELTFIDIDAQSPETLGQRIHV